MPVSGAIPRTALRLTSAWPHTSAVSPAARGGFPNGPRGAERDHEACVAERRERGDDRDRADETELLPDELAKIMSVGASGR